MAENNKSLEDQIKEAELQRIKAETRRIEEERKELQRKNNLPWYRRPAFFQALVAGIVAIPLIWFYMGNVVIPSYNRDNIRLAWENEVTADSLRRAKKLHQAKIDSLNKEKADQAQKHLAELNQIKREYSQIDSIRKVLAAKYERLSQAHSLTQKERDEAKKNLASLQAQNKAQQDKVSKLESQIAQQEQKAATLQADIPVYLSDEDANNIIKRNGYYDGLKNPNGKGITHQYEAKTLSGKKVVIDHTTKLIWQQSGSSDFITYQKAKKYIDQLNRDGFAGFNDWRLPTLEEAMALMESNPSNKNFIDPLFETTQRWIWTSDLYSASAVWVVSFGHGVCGDGYMGSVGSYVRAVRFGH